MGCDECGESLAQAEAFAQRGDHTRRLCMKCDKNERFAEYQHDGILTARAMMLASMMTYGRKERFVELQRVGLSTIRMNAALEIVAAEARIQSEVGRFEEEVWFKGGLQARVRDAETSGTSFEGDGIKMLCFTSGGRALIQIEPKTGDERITLITIEDEGPRDPAFNLERGRGVMGIQGISATEEQALKLIRQAIVAWQTRGSELVADKDVGLLLPRAAG